MPQCWGKNDIWLQYHDPQKGKNGLKDETPAPIVLIITINNGRVEFEKTEFTEKYLKKHLSITTYRSRKRERFLYTQNKYHCTRSARPEHDVKRFFFMSNFLYSCGDINREI